MDKGWSEIDDLRSYMTARDLNDNYGAWRGSRRVGNCELMKPEDVVREALRLLRRANRGGA